MHRAMCHRATGGHQGLPGDLAAEDPLASLVRLGAAEDVHLDRFEVEEVDEGVECFAHGDHDPTAGALGEPRAAPAASPGGVGSSRCAS